LEKAFVQWGWWFVFLSCGITSCDLVTKRRKQEDRIYSTSTKPTGRQADEGACFISENGINACTVAKFLEREQK
jgi:hypothetical protein